MLLLVVEQVIDLILRLELNDIAGVQKLIFAIPCAKLVTKGETKRAKNNTLGIVTVASLILPVPLPSVGWNQIEWTVPLAKRSIVLALV